MKRSFVAATISNACMLLVACGSPFLDAASRNPDTFVILAHEMGHAHGLDDFYDWQPEGWSSWIMWAGTAQYVTETDGWMVRDVWRHVRSD